MKKSKQWLSLLLVLLMVISMVPLTALAADPVELLTASEAEPVAPHDPYLGVRVSPAVPGSFTNDLWLQYDFKELAVGQTATITPRRVPEAITDSTANDLELPHFNYTIIAGDSIVLEGGSNAHQGVRAVKAGSTVVQVTYDAYRHTSGKQSFPACDPVNTQYVAFSVGNSGPAITHNLGTDSKGPFRSYDTLYFNEGDTVLYPLTVKTTGQNLVVRCNGLEVPAASAGQYQLPLENRNNIIEMSVDGRSTFRVLAARKIDIRIRNTTRPGQNLVPGETANISFRGVKMPVYKLATIYNPQWHNSWEGKTNYATNVNYMLNGTKYRGECQQWDLATKNDFNVRFDTSGTFTFTDGKIDSTWWGQPLGYDKNHDGMGKPGLEASTVNGTFSMMPNFTVTVEEPKRAERVILDQEKLILELGGTAKLTATIEPADSTDRLAWATSNAQVVTVRNGDVKVVGAGNAVITASIVGNPEIKAECAVQVKAGPVAEVIAEIDLLPPPELLYVEDAFALTGNTGNVDKGTFAKIQKMYRDLLNQQDQVTNWQHFLDVKEACGQLLKDTPRRIITDDGHVLTMGEKDGYVFKSHTGNYTQHKTLIPDGVKWIKFEQFFDNKTDRYGRPSNPQDFNKRQYVRYDYKKSNGVSSSYAHQKDYTLPAKELKYYTQKSGSIGYGAKYNGVQGNYFVVDAAYFKTWDQNEAARVDGLIDAIGPVALDKELQIQKARAEYQHMPKSAQALVSKLTVLQEAEAKLEELKTQPQVPDGTAEAQAWDAQVDAISSASINKESKEALEKARDDYNKLSPEAKELVKNLPVLEKLEADYKEWLAAEDEARPVNEAIANLGPVNDLTLEDAPAVEKIRDAYSRLSEKAKQIIYLEGLTQAEARIEELKNEIPAVHVIVENTTYATADGAAWDNVLVDTMIPLDETLSMMDCIRLAVEENGKTITIESLEKGGYISEIGGLKAMDGGQMSGWMGTLNNWFTDKGFCNFTVANGSIHAGDKIRVMYTVDGGADLGGDYSAKRGNLSVLSVEPGVIVPSLKQEVLDYAVILEAPRKLTVTALAENKQDQVLLSVGDKIYYHADQGERVNVADGTVLEIKCGSRTYSVTVLQSRDVEETMKLIDQIGELSQETVRVMAAARAVYDHLPEEQQRLVTNYEKLTKAEADLIALKERAAAVDKQIAELMPVDLTKAQAVADARALYEGLGQYGKQLVENEKILKTAEEHLTELQQEANNAAAAAAVDLKISEIGDVTLEKEAQIQTARNVYDNLNSEQKALVQNLNVLKAAEQKLAELKEVAADQEAAAAVDEKILGIGKVSLTSAGKIAEAREAYRGLSQKQKALVKNLSILETAEAELEKQKQDAAAVGTAMEELLVEKADQCTYDTITAIQEAYNALDGAQRDQLTVQYSDFQIKKDLYQELLEAAQKDTRKQLEGIYSDLSSADYTAEQWTNLKACYDKAMTDVGEAEYQEALDRILSAFREKAANRKPAPVIPFKPDVMQKPESPVRIGFADVQEQDWFYEDVCFAVERALFQGTSSDTFSPDAPMTRAMLVTVLYRLEGEPLTGRSAAFRDVEPGQWYSEPVCWAAENGIVNGVAENVFAPHDNVTREQMAAILYRFAQYKSCNTDRASDLSGYADYSQVSAFAQKGMQWAHAEGLIQGRTETMLVPAGMATRAEVAAILHRFLLASGM